jgi:hypothetical protein
MIRAHGWNTEWSRIRDIGTQEIPDYLMIMHGMFWRFPSTFTSGNSKGITRSTYLKVIDDNNRRWRLPLGNEEFTPLTRAGFLRICREVATERDLFNCMGTFYELPAENADGFAKIRPVASHNLRINDYASYRGMLIMTEIDPERSDKNEHIIISADNKAFVWAGVIDDLWKLGKTTGHGGPWKNSEVTSGIPSDPTSLVSMMNEK